MRILSIRHILFTHQATFGLLLFLRETASSSSFVAASILVHVPKTPAENDGELNSEADGASDGAGYVSRGGGGLKDE